MRYAITGATGFLGGELARQLREAGHEVVALVRTPSKATALSELGVELVAGDLDDAAALDRICDGADGLFHVAGWYKLGLRKGAEEGDRVNVQGTRNALEAAKRNNVARVVYTSTVAINSDTHGVVRDEDFHFTGTHISHYDRTKAEAHVIAKSYAAEGLDVVLLQPGIIYGPGDTAQTGQMLADVVAGKRPQVPAGGEGCWAHVSDVARGHVLAMEKGESGRSYMLAGPRSTLAGALKKAAALAGTKGPMVVPDAMIKVMTAIMSVLARVLPVPALYQPETLKAGLATYLGTGDRARRELGWESRPLDEGLAGTVEYLRRG